MSMLKSITMKKLLNLLETLFFIHHREGEKIEYGDYKLRISRTIVPYEFERNYPYWDKQLYNNIIYI